MPPYLPCSHSLASFASKAVRKYCAEELGNCRARHRAAQRPVCDGARLKSLTHFIRSGVPQE